jgi:CSLREA domain-containing protein
VLALAIVALALGPATAGAVGPYVINSTGDAGDASPDGTCDSDAGAPVVCTLREAIEEANNDVAPDAITFDDNPFNGQAADAIDIGATALPAITQPATISCEALPPSDGPCAQVGSPPPGSNVFTVNADGVTIRDVSVTNALTGVSVFDPVPSGQITGFALKNTWVGITLAGTTGAGVASHNEGVFLDASVDGATIGGTNTGVLPDRNVISANNNIGLHINGDNTAIEGNYFGVLADGFTQAAQPVNIRIAGVNQVEPSPDLPATGNVVGGVLSVPQQTSQACDGRCNVISGAVVDGIDLESPALGEMPAGQTTIQGNYLGFDAQASTVVANSGVGVDVGAADNVSVGTPGTGSPDGMNRFVGGTTGVRSTAGSDGLQVRGNRFGVSFNGSQILGALGVGIDVFSETAAAAITNNLVSTATGDGIFVRGDNPVVSHNLVGVGQAGQDLGIGGSGIYLFGTTGAVVDSNTVGSSSHGVLVDLSTGTILSGNSIGPDTAPNLGYGVYIGNGSTDTIVGSDSPAGFNTLANNSNGGVGVAGATTDGNEIRGNLGFDNGGLFIDLGDDGPGPSGGANNNLAAPVITDVDEDSASGTATPGATVRLFEKTVPDNGEIAGFLGSAVADGGGDWEIAHSSPLDFLGATQTTGVDGTSEMAVAEIATPDTAAPDTTITKKPKKKSTKRKAKFKFSSSEDGSTFECKLDRKPFKPCDSPFKKKVKPKKHKFKVRAIDAAGNVDPTPAKAKFKVLKPE